MSTVDDDRAEIERLIGRLVMHASGLEHLATTLLSDLLESPHAMGLVLGENISWVVPRVKFLAPVDGIKRWGDAMQAAVDARNSIVHGLVLAVGDNLHTIRLQRLKAGRTDATPLTAAVIDKAIALVGEAAEATFTFVEELVSAGRLTRASSILIRPT